MSQVAMPQAASLETSAHAKINLALAVTGRRADGYHELRSIFLRLELADTLILGDATGPVDELVIEGDADCPVADNLVVRAVDGFRAAAAAAEVAAAVPPVRVALTKRIPMAAGLAGGSTDAAATLRILALRHPGAVTAPALATVAARIGADVPFFLNGPGAALVSGIGALVEPLPPPIDPVGVLLLSPPTGASTEAVFGAWDAHLAATGPTDSHRDPDAAAVVESLAHLLRTGVDALTLTTHALAIRDANDLWPGAAAVTPGLGSLRTTVERLLGRPVMLTGSGSTLFCLYPSPEAAAADAHRMRSERSLADLRISVTCSTGPYIPAITTRRDP